jgi:AraC-like DNA-binding protein
MPDIGRVIGRMGHSATWRSTALSEVELVDIVSDRQFPRHAHDHYGIGLMLKGGHESWSGRGEVEAGPGQVITVNPNEIHDGRSVGGQPRHWRMMFVDPALVARLGGDELAGRELTMPVCGDPVRASAVGDALRLLAEVGGAETEAEEIMVDLFDRLLDRSRPCSYDPGNSPEVARMIERILDSLSDAPGLDELARLGGMTPTTCLRRFRKEVGTTPYAYLMQARVRQARNMIARGASLADAAIDLGFADQSHMTRAFTRQFGISPGRWRGAQRACASVTISTGRRRDSSDIDGTGSGA